ncbi:MAG: phosphatidylserine/phosphatidylglycerophosphate/cardiolipin synthase family protein [Elusimicrobiota bacterium]|jgi:phosphatidylserine/phosphatidylglycerophosphate/cardiolipin synthase-like enzyme
MMRSLLSALLFLQSAPAFAQTVVGQVPLSASAPAVAPVAVVPGAGGAGTVLQPSALAVGGLPTLGSAPVPSAGHSAEGTVRAESSSAHGSAYGAVREENDPRTDARRAAPTAASVSGVAGVPVRAAASFAEESSLAAGTDKVVSSVREAVASEGREGAAHAALSARFDGAADKAAAAFSGAVPAAGQSAAGTVREENGPRTGEHAPPVPGLPETVVFNGHRFAPAQFTDEGAGRMSAKLIEALDAAKETMELALLELMHRELLEAVLRAKERGVKVRIVVDATHMYPSKPGQTRAEELQRLIDAGFDIRVLRGGKEHGLMHNKFALLDGKLVWSGSANWSRAADKLHQENVTYTSDAHRIGGFQGSFDWMWGLGRPVGEEPGAARGTPPSDPTRPVSFNGAKLPAYVFAPGVETEERLLEAISASRVSIDVAMFSCTSARLREALLAARQRGVRVRIVFDAVQYSHLFDMAWFYKNGFDVRIAVGLVPEKGAMHNKFVVFDGVMVQTGSYNWTENAKFNNFENAQFFADPGMAAAYAAYFDRVRARGRQVTEADAAQRPALPAPQGRPSLTGPGEQPKLPAGRTGHERRGAERPGKDRRHGR